MTSGFNDQNEKRKERILLSQKWNKNLKSEIKKSEKKRIKIEKIISAGKKKEDKFLYIVLNAFISHVCQDKLKL